MPQINNIDVKIIMAIIICLFFVDKVYNYLPYETN